MRREGRQHGMVRFLPSPVNPRPGTRIVSKFDSPPTAGLFTKVPSKPTNHSKFTGKCGTPRCNGCHVNPARKSKPKTKGARKLKSGDVVVNSRLFDWRVVDGEPGLSFSGSSATDLVDHMFGLWDYNDDFDFFYDDPWFDSFTFWLEFYSDSDSYYRSDMSDDNMSFCDVEFRLDEVEEDEGWSVESTDANLSDIELMENLLRAKMSKNRW